MIKLILLIIIKTITDLIPLSNPLRFDVVFYLLRRGFSIIAQMLSGCCKTSAITYIHAYLFDITRLSAFLNWIAWILLRYINVTR